MVQNTSQFMSPEALTYMIHHIFLPPKLPQSNDFKPAYEACLLKVVHEALLAFQTRVAAESAGNVDFFIEMAAKFIEIHSAADASVSEFNLEQALEWICGTGKVFPLHVRAQNAGILISRVDQSIKFEAFELSPRNEAVVSTVGRLNRRFPAVACSLAIDQIAEPELRHTIAHTLAKMSIQEAPNTRPKVKKAHQLHEEVRDTTHPKLVTELFMAFLSSIGKREDVKQLGKNTREEVLWRDSLLPWRRSSTWLLIRVALQLVFARSTFTFNTPQDPYKVFMIFFMSILLDKTLSCNVSMDLRHVMERKITRRLLKLGSLTDGPTYEFISTVLSKSHCLMQAEWSETVQETGPGPCQSPLEQLKFEQDVDHDLGALDGYISCMSTWEQTKTVLEVHVTPRLSKWGSSEFPSRFSIPGEDEPAHHLHAFESWVSLHLAQCLDAHIEKDATCEKLSGLMRSYHDVASSFYSGDPESISRMLLVMLELWIACDKAATQRCSLLGHYDAGIPVELCQSLLLPSRSLMERLAQVEEYISCRRVKACYAAPAIYQSFGTPDCFAARYFNESPNHQALLEQIEAEAHAARLRKRADFERKKMEYETLITLENESNCDYREVITDSHYGFRESRHDPSCRKCGYGQKAAAIEIQVHEWPLSSDRTEARSTVFELRVPQWFGYWRNTTLFLLLDVLELEMTGGDNSQRTHALQDDTLLRSHFIAYGGVQHVSLLSQVKSHTKTHRRSRKIATTSSVNEICLENGLWYRYYNSDTNQLVTAMRSTEGITNICTYRMPSRSVALQQFLVRTSERPSGPTPNTVIASQSHCPDHIPLDDYKAMCSIPLGFRLAWINILVQLSVPTIDFSKLETVFIVLQSILQAGPRGEKQTLRESHAILDEYAFARELLGEAEKFCHRIEENWESLQALSVLTSLVLRLLALNAAQDVSEACLSLLAQMRAVAFRWLQLLRDKAHATAETEERTKFMSKAVRVALICADSFNVGENCLSGVLMRSADVSILCQCYIVIRDGKVTVANSSDPLTTILYRRWQSLSYRVYHLLAAVITEGRDPGLDNAVTASWSTYAPGTSWSLLSAEFDHCLVCETAPQQDGTTLSVHFNLLTGELLVNGRPMSQLTQEYYTHPSYKRLFGRSYMEFMPSAVPGMQFSGKRRYAGFEIHLGLKPTHAPAASGHDLLVQIEKGGDRFIFIPPRLLDGEFPTSFVRDYVHWYGVGDGSVRFCHASKPWSFATNYWKLAKRNQQAWHLVKGELTLVCVRSRTAKALSHILSALEDPMRIHITYQASQSSVAVEIPQTKLSFSARSGSASLLSQQYRGMAVDPDQTLGTLVGLRDKLILKHQETGRRLLILLEGSVSCERSANHVAIRVNKSTVVKAHTYRVDVLLGRLVTDGALQSQLLLCYFHALTSSCLPDPLLGITGTEQALSILRSARMRSYDVLSQTNYDILSSIARISPRRAYYPAYERVMQTIEWSSELGFMAQHNMLHDAVREILDYVERAEIFYPETSKLHRDFPETSKTLSHRDRIRSSTFYVSQFGAEGFTTKHDGEYSGRDQGQGREQADNAYAMASFIHNGYTSLRSDTINNNTRQQLWAFLAPCSPVFGESRALPPHPFRYDAKLLEKSGFDPKNWCGFHKTISRRGLHFEKFGFMIWLSTLAFGGSIDMEVLEVVALFYNLPQMAEVTFPTAHAFQLSQGYSVDQHRLREALSPALLAFHSCPEAQSVTSPRQLKQQKNIAKSNQDQYISTAVSHLAGQWPCKVPTRPAFSDPNRCSQYVDRNKIMRIVEPMFSVWYDNYLFHLYLGAVGQIVEGRIKIPIQMPVATEAILERITSRLPGFVSIGDILSLTPPTSQSSVKFCADFKVVTKHLSERVRQVPDLIARLEARAASDYERSYVDNMRNSLLSLHSVGTKSHLAMNRSTLAYHLRRCNEQVDGMQRCLIAAMSPAPKNGAMRSVSTAAIQLQHGPRLCRTFLLQLLNRHYWSALSRPWKEWIVQFGLALCEVQRMERLIGTLDVPEDFTREMANPGHTNWEAIDHPESLLLEVESGILIRDVQEEIAKEMRDPEDGQNAVMQLNMGEGKSSVIVPIVAAHLANGSRLVRVLVARPQAKQMFQMLISKLGGLLDRRIYKLPFSRALGVGKTGAESIASICKECMRNAGILLVQPEHVLSLKLMGLQTSIAGELATAKSLLSTQHFFDTTSRDIVDESDENFSVKFELVYAIGTQRPIDSSPDRWTCIQQVLTSVGNIARILGKELASSIEVQSRCSTSFPQIRILKPDAQRLLLQKLAYTISEDGLIGFPTATQQAAVRQAVLRYIGEADLSAEEVDRLEREDLGKFWSPATREILLLLRGLIAGDVLAFAFRQKRWRVNYGLHLTRERPTKLAVPYRAKDSPNERSEFSHPDVVIVLTCLCYYYGGLAERDLFLALSHLKQCDQADEEYLDWVRGATNLPPAFGDLSGINLEDERAFRDHIFPNLRYAKSAVDYFLAHVVFPKEMREFPHKLSASGWDLGKQKSHPTTGFSGTNDSEKTLPLDMRQLHLSTQNHTNALVLSYLLRTENSVIFLPPPGDLGSMPDQFLTLVTELSPPTRVILDVGAQIIELSNLEVAQEWLRRSVDDDHTRAAVFFDGGDELSVVDRKGNVEALHSSSFVYQLETCLIFLDEAHTRGTDLKLPLNYRASVTLGPHVTKDKLVQACMRMRRLGHGQSVVFCVPEEVKNRVAPETAADMTVSDVLCWAISETWADVRQSMPLWAVQGLRYHNQSMLWADACIAGEIQMTKDQAMPFLEDEAQSLEQRYRPGAAASIHHISATQEGIPGRIWSRCQEFSNREWNSAKLQEQQERELAPEIEQERQVQKPDPAQPAEHSIHPDLRAFIATGKLRMANGVFAPAFHSLKDTSAAAHLGISQFPSNVLATIDFSRTIRAPGFSYVADAYQRSPQWVLMGGTASTPTTDATEYLVIISPFEAQELLPSLRQSKYVTLHVYSPRSNLNHRALDDLRLYTVPERPGRKLVPLKAILQLNLFAGQLYFGSFGEYRDVCELLGVIWRKAEQGRIVAPDGFVGRSGQDDKGICAFRESPVKFLHVLMTKIRRNCEGIEKTHMGAVLSGRLLQSSDFDENTKTR